MLQKGVRLGLLLVLLLSLISSVAWASVNGFFKGYPIVRVVVNGQEVDSDVPGVNLEGRTVLPVRAIAEALNLGVDWDPATSTVTLTSGTIGVTPNSGFENGYLYVKSIPELGPYLRDPKLLETYHGVVVDAEDGLSLYLVADLRLFATNAIGSDELVRRGRFFIPQSAQMPVPNTGNVDTLPGLTGNTLVIGQDSHHTYLGTMSSNTVDPESICNSVGLYGSPVSSTSIWNEVGLFGSSVSTFSAFNELAINPPMLVQDGELVGYLTTNSLKIGAVSPYGICQRLRDAGW